MRTDRFTTRIDRQESHRGRSLTAMLGLACTLVVFLGRSPCAADDDLQVRASWSEPVGAELCDCLDSWLADLNLDEGQHELIDAARAELLDAASAQQRFDALITAVAHADPEAMGLLQACQAGSAVRAEPLGDLAERCKWPSVVTANMQLMLGKSLAIEQLYDEARAQLAQLDVETVADPASLLFYLGATQYRLRDRDAGMKTLGKLLERNAEIPARYATIARLMEAELKATKPDSLGEIAQIMDSIRVRLDHGRAGKRVRDEEQEVIDKLDKMIDQLEKQLQQMQAAQAGSMGGNMPSSPMQDSMPGGGSGPGDVEPKALGDRTDWGDLPPKQREEALQQIGEEFPSHYRHVIEEYFRQLAKEAG